MMTRAFQRIVCLGAAATLALASAFAGADEIKYGGVNYPNIRILGLRDGRLIFQTAAGIESQVPLGDVESLSVNAYPELAKADAAVVEQNYAEAARQLESIVGKVQEDYLQVLVRAKLAMMLDRAGRPVDATKHYLMLLRINQGDLAQAAVPRKVPEDAKQRKAMADMVESELKATADVRVRELLEPVLAALKAAPGDAPAMLGPANQGSTPGPALLVGEAEATRDLIEEALAAGKHQQALGMVEKDLENSRLDLSKLLYQRGRAQAGVGKDMDAAISFMRVAVHFPQSEYAPSSLIEAAKVFKKLNRNESARAALQEARTLTGDEAKVQEIDALLNTLK
jgi:tetratricopeptide (TPR) repeat protein